MIKSDQKWFNIEILVGKFVLYFKHEFEEFMFATSL